MVFFEQQPKFGQKRGKNDNFSHFAKQRLLKTVLLQPPFWPKIGVLQLVLFETKNIDVEKKHDWKSAKTKIRKRVSNRKQDRKSKKRHRIDETNFAIEYFDVVTFHETKANKTEEEKSEKKKEPKKAKKRKTRRKKERTRKRERQITRNLTSGRPKKGSGETKGDTQK